VETESSNNMLIEEPNRSLHIKQARGQVVVWLLGRNEESART